MEHKGIKKNNNIQLHKDNFVFIQVKIFFQNQGIGTQQLLVSISYYITIKNIANVINAQHTHNSSDNRVVILSSDVDESAPLQVFQTSTLHRFYVKVANGSHINGSCHGGVQKDTLSGSLGTSV